MDGAGLPLLASALARASPRPGMTAVLARVLGAGGLVSRGIGVMIPGASAITTW